MLSFIDGMLSFIDGMKNVIIHSREELQRMLGVKSIEENLEERRLAWVQRKVGGNCRIILEELKLHRDSARSSQEDRAWWGCILKGIAKKCSSRKPS